MEDENVPKTDRPNQLTRRLQIIAGGKLDANNRWVKMANLIPWDVVEDRYAEQFPKHTGNVANRSGSH